jgi:transcriptional antiterminator RfaH
VTERAAHWLMNTSENWFVLYTKSRQEKVLASQLMDAGYEVYLPLLKKLSQWSDRKKVLEVPLFNSYVFIKGVNEKARFKNFNSFVAFLQYNNKPAIVRQTEIDTLKSIIQYGYDINEFSTAQEFKIGNKVEVSSGPLKGITGKLVSISNVDWFVLNFEGMGNGIQVKIPGKLLLNINE